MKTKYHNNYKPTQLTRNCTEEGESIEQMLRRLTMNKEPIPQNVPPIYTPEKDGVLGDYNIRHDRFDTAYEARNKFNASQIAKSAERGETEDGNEIENDNGGEQSNE